MKLKNLLDMHLHLRDNQMLELIAPLSARDFCAAVIMPNLIPPLCNLEDLKAYKMR
ncbi:dihydroorotase, partial [Campylobacter jejuni]|nr:dihydroorotase [Campylobacter jejuni]